MNVLGGRHDARTLLCQHAVDLLLRLGLRDRWHTMHVSCLDVPRAQGHIEDIKAKYGDASNAYRVRVLGEFPTSDDETVIPLELVLGAVERNVSTLDSGGLARGFTTPSLQACTNSV